LVRASYTFVATLYQLLVGTNTETPSDWHTIDSAGCIKWHECSHPGTYYLQLALVCIPLLPHAIKVAQAVW